ncbi:MAG: AmmeMemoRadiSam system protein B [Clostridia bacterium]
MATVRPAAVAGLFYPGDPKALAAELDELLGEGGVPQPRLGFPKALVVPHAGYVYSGPVAARAYEELAAARGVVKRVVLLGPVHRVPVRGLALPSVDFFDTPLGRIPIDREFAEKTQGLPQVVRNDAAHAMEHSIEVQLPFLQRVLGSFSLVPLAVGDATVQEVAGVLDRLWGGRETLIVISTDLSHYHPYAEAKAIDANTIARISRLATDIHHEEACGATGLNGFLSFLRNKHLEIRLLSACNSGDTAGGKGQVVGYSSFAAYEPGGAVSLDEAGKVLLPLARGSIEGKLFSRGLSVADAPWLAQAGATFVTLTKGGSLRGCIGSLQAAQPLGIDVASNAIGAAFRDPRFPAVTPDEWREVRVEVSLLSAPKAMLFADEADLLRQVEPGLDGIILESGGRRATFLPQVWETLPDKQVFFGELLMKAGLAGTRLGQCQVSRYRVEKWKE